MKRIKILIAGAILIIILGVALYPTPFNPPIRYIDRGTHELKTEKVAGEKWLVWLYNNPVGELTLHALVKRKFVSSIYGYLMDRPSSADRIARFVKAYDIDMSIARKQHFKTFNDFFIRKLKKSARPIDMDPSAVTSPADGKVLAYQNISNQDFFVKGYRFNLESFLKSRELAQKYRDGSVMIFRLCPADYHRFHFPVNGVTANRIKIDGDYFSVSPIALRRMVEIFCQNKREYVRISTKNFGDIIMAEVGATMVGCIVQTYKGNTAWKGQEKGYFKFGGSSIVLIFEKGRIQIDEDLLQNTERHFETSIHVGEHVATAVHVFRENPETESHQTVQSMQN